MGAKWFRNFGNCQDCPKAAMGELFDERNGLIGRFCGTCSHRRLQMDAPKGDTLPRSYRQGRGQ